jgi:hypothetical protein
MLSQSLLYFSNSCISINFKTLKSNMKTIKIISYRFRYPWKPFLADPSPYSYSCLKWNVDVHLLQKLSAFWMWYSVLVYMFLFVGKYLVETSLRLRQSLHQVDTHTEMVSFDIQPHIGNLYNIFERKFHFNNIAK